MLNSIINTWVKNVNNKRLIDRITGEKQYTNSPQLTSQLNKYCVQAGLINSFVNQICTLLSTYLKPISYLKNNSFTHYPHSLLICNPKKN